MSDGAGNGGLRSARWFGPADLGGFLHRASIHAEGISRHALAGRPVIGICNSWSELVNCNVHFRGLAESVKRGVLTAGGLPLEFPTISLGENLMKPTTMLYRNLMAMDVEESIRSYPLDAVVLIGGCDKTVPAQLMGAASADVPAIMITGGPSEPAFFRGRELGVGTDLWHYVDELRAGRMTQAEFDELEAAHTPSVGHCNEMGTASTMTSLVEALGMSLPGTASIPAVDARRRTAAEATGRRAVEIAREGPRPSEILTAAAFDNAITLLMALGGSTNAVIHLLALAGRLGVPLTLDRFDEISRRTPIVANLRPSGEYLVENLFHAGGVPAVLGALAPLLDGDALTVTGRGLGDAFAGARSLDEAVVGSLQAPFAAQGGIAVVRGTLAPDGAVVKRSAASPDLLRHRGPAVVFEDIDDLSARIDDPDLDVSADSVLVLRNAGPRGAPGMPEWGMLPIPAKLLRAGVTDMVRISDARMSGTAFGTVVLHVAPEAAAGGPLAIVRDGDPVVLDVDARRVDLDLPDREIAQRLADRGPGVPRYRRGYGQMFLEHVLQADTGCDFDFLRAVPGEAADREPYGLLSGWIGGW
ncbi:MAG TPA: IlvD/Edd family dehydratase [Solirubrobacteraceae bacterium]|jgi:dihydroxy-acid dehydratase|nr:IlvD/Edd family dehydratase [Solirubrobacteraceae bacterium]